MVPDIVDIGRHFLSEFLALLRVLLLEVLQHEFVGERTVEFDCRVHCRADYRYADPHACCAHCVDEQWAAEVEEVAVREDNDSQHET